jgi:hypothetical protein
MASDLRLPVAPKGLTARSRGIWRGVNRDFDLLDHEQAILEQSLRALDRSEEARAAVDRDGAVVQGRYGPKVHPAAALERDSRTAFLRGLRELGLDPNAVETRPPPRPRKDSDDA